MKRAVDITLTTLHVGECRRVVTVGINQKDHAQSFLLKLFKDDYKKWRSLYARVQTVSKYHTFENKLTFRHVGGGIFEFKRPGVRLYAFYDTLGGEEQLILCTNGGKKNTKRQQSADIDRALKIKSTYLEAKTREDTHLTLLP